MGLGPQAATSVFTTTILPGFATPPAIQNFVEPQYSSQDPDLFNPVLGPVMSPDGTRLALISGDVYAVPGIIHKKRRNMRAPPVFTDIGGAVTDTAAVVSKTAVCETAFSFTILASDSSGEALTYGAPILPSGATFNASTRTFSWTPVGGNSCNHTHYIKFIVTTPSGGMDQILCKITVGGLSLRKEQEPPVASASVASGIVAGPIPRMAASCFRSCRARAGAARPRFMTWPVGVLLSCVLPAVGHCLGTGLTATG